MDDRTWYLAIGSLGASVGLVILDAILPGFQLGGAFYAVPSGVLGFLAARAAVKDRRNGNGDSE